MKGSKDSRIIRKTSRIFLPKKMRRRKENTVEGRRQAMHRKSSSLSRTRDVPRAEIKNGNMTAQRIKIKTDPAVEITHDSRPRAPARREIG